MQKEIDYHDLLKLENYVLIDLRTEDEYEKYNIPNSFNLPILNNEEYKEVGTIYKKSIEDAKEKGVFYVSCKLLNFYQSLKSLANNKRIIVYCSRGGMRSSVVSSTFSALGMPIIKLVGGYKEYRKIINRELNDLINEIDFITLYGLTGSGKTKILHEIAKEGLDILDLEKAANHRGSIFGSIGLSVQNSQKQFESLIFDSLVNRKTNTVFVESESSKIGNLFIPQHLHEKIHKSKNIYIDTCLEKRILNIKEEYLTNLDKSKVKDSLNRLNKYINQNSIEKYKKQLDNNEYDELIESLIVNYYDKNYKSRRNANAYDKTYINNNEKETAKKIILDIKK